MASNLNDKLISEDIKAEVQKTNSRLIFVTVVLFMFLIGFWVRTCSKMPPELNGSVECVKAGGQWIPEKYEVMNFSTNTIKAYCSLNKK